MTPENEANDAKDEINMGCGSKTLIKNISKKKHFLTNFRDQIEEKFGINENISKCGQASLKQPVLVGVASSKTADIVLKNVIQNMTQIFL
jgi:hypothetical protein